MVQWMMELFGTYDEITQPILINLDWMCYTEDTPKLYMSLVCTDEDLLQKCLAKLCFVSV